MPVAALHHYTIRCTPDDLPTLQDFYTRVMRLEIGARPAIPVPGAWLYANGQPIVHLFAHLSAAGPSAASVTGPLDHISFRSVDLREMRDHLSAQGVSFIEAPIPELNILQLFLQDPLGLKIELTFWLDDEKARA